MIITFERCRAAFKPRFLLLLRLHTFADIEMITHHHHAGAPALPALPCRRVFTLRRRQLVQIGGPLPRMASVTVQDSEANLDDNPAKGARLQRLLFGAEQAEGAGQLRQAQVMLKGSSMQSCTPARMFTPATRHDPERRLHTNDGS